MIGPIDGRRSTYVACPEAMFVPMRLRFGVYAGDCSGAPSEPCESMARRVASPSTSGCRLLLRHKAQNVFSVAVGTAQRGKAQHSTAQNVFSVVVGTARHSTERIQPRCRHSTAQHRTYSASLSARHSTAQRGTEQNSIQLLNFWHLCRLVSLRCKLGCIPFVTGVREARVATRHREAVMQWHCTPSELS